jgi:hypothetical protein
MKKILTISALAFSIAFVSGCEKEADLVANAESVAANKALLKINFVSTYAANPSVQFKLNDVRVSNLITARTPYPGGGYNTGGGSTNDYLAVDPGTIAMSIAIPNKNTNTDSIMLFKTNLTLDPGKNYTAHITDTAANTKVLLTLDDVNAPDTGLVKYRFVNLMPNVPAIDLYYDTIKVASNIAYLTSSNYFTMPVPAASLTWSIREANAAPTSTALATYSSANTILRQRVYTAFALGYKGATDATRKPYVSFYLNK